MSRDGYKMTELGEIPQEWEVKILGELCEKPSYGAGVSAVDYDKELPRYVRITDITDSGILIKNDIKSCLLEDYHIYRLKIGDIVFARSGATVGKTYMYKIEDGDCVYAGYLIKFSVRCSCAEVSYLFQFTHSPIYCNWVKMTLREGAQPNINSQEYSALMIPLPPLPEQQSIAEILSTNDALITKTDELIEKTKEIKQGLMQELLTKGIGHTEFKDSELGKIPKDWEVKKLGDSSCALKITQGPNPKYDIGEVVNNLRILKTKDLYDKGINYLSADKISEETFKSCEKAELKDKDILIAIVGKGSIGKSNIFIARNDIRYLFTRALGLVRLNQEHVYPDYLNQYFQSPRAKLVLNDGIGGSTGQEVLQTSYLKEISIPIPSLDEQHRIVDILHAIDLKIKMQESKKQQLQQIKQGLMQDLLTGRVRVGGIK
jgi:type I restriction enzyme, S subunit